MEPVKTISINGKDLLFVVDESTIGDISAALDTRISKTLLWENASPTSGFASQGIAVDLTGYDEIEVEFTSPKNGTVGADLRRRETLSLCAIDTDSDVLCASYVQAIYAVAEIYSRAFQIGKLRSAIMFFSAFKTTGSTLTSGTASPAQLVPYKIYGIKGVTV